MTKMQNFLKGIITENPVLVLVLGTCPTLAMTKSVSASVGMGVSVLAVLLVSNIVISALRKVIPDKVRIPCYIVVIAAIVTAVQMLLHAYMPDIYDTMGVYLPLITVNCIILGRAEMYAGKNKVLDSAVDALGMGCGFTLALFIMGSVREIFGAGTWFGLAIPWLNENPVSVLTLAPGGFFVFGCTIALVNRLTKGRAKRRREFGCGGCPAAFYCSKLDKGGNG